MKLTLLTLTFAFALTQTTLAEAPITELPEVNKIDYYKDMIRSYDWNDDIAIAIMMAESSGKEDVVNWGDNHNGCIGSAGLFQIGCVNAPIEEMKDPKKNIEKAYQLYSERGWKPWGAYTNKSYLKFL
jgi:hypothetical protein